MHIVHLRTAVATLATVTLVAGCGSTGPATPSPALSLAATSAVPAPAPASVIAPAPPATTPDAHSAPPPTPVPGAGWTALDLPPVPVVADLTSSSSLPAGIPADATFTLRSLTSTPAATLAATLSVEPKVGLAVVTDADPSRVMLRPTTPLARSTTYRFTLVNPDLTMGGGWAFRVAGPPRVVGTIPRDQVTRVPVSTGIEIAFDQPGVADPSPWFSIEPKVAGRFEQHDRTWVFVPDDLAPATLYTISLRAGIPLGGSDLVTQESTVVRFETEGPEAKVPYHLDIGRRVVEAMPGEAPVVGVEIWWRGEERKLPASVTVTLHRIDGLQAAAAAAAALADRPGWTDQPRDAVDVSALPVVALAHARLEGAGSAGPRRWLRFPGPLAPGWYLADLPDDVAPGEQALIAVTPLATYAAIGRDRTVVWVNRIGGGPVAGATVRLAEGPTLGRTGTDGLLVAPTPVAIRPQRSDEPWRLQETTPHPVVVVSAPGIGSAVLPAGIGSSGGYASETWAPGTTSLAAARWISSLQTERYAYRATDSIATWGVVRDRATGKAPASVRLELYPQASYGGTWEPEAEPVAVARVDAAPSPTGVFTATLPVEGLPLDAYTVALSVDGQKVREQWIQVDVIRKPAFRLAFDVDRRAVFAGDTVTAIATATAYDGTPMPGVPVRLDARGTLRTWEPDETVPVVVTGSDGTASVAFSPVVQYGYANAFVASPELGEIHADGASVVAFPSHVHVAIDEATRSGDVVEVTGSVRRVDLAAVERSLRADEPWDRDVGPPAAGVRVTVRATPTVWVASRSGTEYDFVLKKTVPRHTYTEKDLATVKGVATTRADGTFLVRVALPVGARGTNASIHVVAAASDARGRTSEADRFAGTYLGSDDASTRHAIWLDPGPPDAPAMDPRACGWAPTRYAVGDTVRLVLRGIDGPLPTGGGRRYLFIAARDGIRDIVLRSTPGYVRAFDGPALPSLRVSAIAFDGATYRESMAGTLAAVDLASRRIGVTVTTDLTAGAVHRPGDAASVTIRTSDASGRPVAADVVVRGVDEKLYEMGLAWDDDQVDALWGPLDAGIAATYLSHRLPAGDRGLGCGASTGGGGGAGGDLREDFRDRIVFTRVRTDPDGTATVPLALPDDLTSWHVAALAVTPDLRVGTGAAQVPVGLPFFVEPVAPDTVLSVDRPAIILRAYGSALSPGDTVRYTVRAPTLRPGDVTLTARAFDTAIAWLVPTGSPPAAGKHRIVVEGVARTASGEVRDAKALTLEVVGTRSTVRRTEVVTIGDATAVPGSPRSMTTCTLADSGRASLLPMLEWLAADAGPRADQGAAAVAAAGILEASFGRDPASVTDVGFEASRYLSQGDIWSADGVWRPSGVAIMPYGSPDLELTALAALGAPGVFDRASLEGYLTAVFGDSDTPRDRRIVALAGLATLGLPVTGDLRLAADADRAAAGGPATNRFTDPERAWLAMGLAEAGDLGAAIEVERRVLAGSGQRSGGWARAVAPTTHESVQTTALLAIAAAAAGDPLAPDLMAYVLGTTDTEAVHPLEEVAYAARALARLPRVTARAAYTVGGERHEVDLTPGQGSTIALTPAQRTAASLQRIAGSVAAACSWDAPATGDALPADPSVRIERTVTPSGPVSAGSLVSIDLTVTFAPSAVQGLYRAVDVLPSGLAPTGRMASPPTTDSSVPIEKDVIRPWSISGNRVEWGVWFDGQGSSFVLRTTGRVVAPGFYAWEPAIVQSVVAPTAGARTPATTITVRAP